MNILGIDYGKKKVGVAASSGSLAFPLKVIKYSRDEKLIQEIKNLLEREKATVLIIGVSEGESERAAREFGEKVSRELLIPIHFMDETLTTADAELLSLEAGIKRSKRKKMEDAYAAALVLQNYLDSH
jgi:putative Holliday junction resolvase